MTGLILLNLHRLCIKTLCHYGQQIAVAARPALAPFLTQSVIWPGLRQASSVLDFFQSGRCILFSSHLRPTGLSSTYESERPKRLFGGSNNFLLTGFQPNMSHSIRSIQSGECTYFMRRHKNHIWLQCIPYTTIMHSFLLHFSSSEGQKYFFQGFYFSMIFGPKCSFMGVGSCTYSKSLGILHRKHTLEAHGAHFQGLIVFQNCSKHV